MKNKIHPEIAEEQYGFQPDKSTRNPTFFLRILSERAIEMQQDLHVCFIDYKKAFDRLKHEIVLKKLRGGHRRQRPQDRSKPVLRT